MSQVQPNLSTQRITMPTEGWETYLCSYCNGFWTARAGSVDRCTEARCPNCATYTPVAHDAIDDARLRWMEGA